MWQIDEGKVIALTRGDLGRLVGKKSERRSKACCEKSAEAIVPGVFFREGLNNRMSQVHTGSRVGAMKAEYRKGCLQRDSVEREKYAGAQSNDTREIEKEAVQKACWRRY